MATWVWLVEVVGSLHMRGRWYNSCGMSLGVVCGNWI